MIRNKSKKAMLGNLIGGFVAIMIGVMLIPMVSQEMNNALNCNQTNSTNISYQEPLGETDSFGGGGAGQFGGYDGQVHKSWASNLAVYKTNQTFTGLCLNDNSVAATALKLVPAFFALAIILMSIGIAYSALRNSGLA